MDYPSTSGETHSLPLLSPDTKLILYADPATKNVMKYSESKLDPAINLGHYSLEQTIVEDWFQDNTKIFNGLLNDRRSFVMCIYPPGSGKSTIAKLLKYYLHRNSDEMPDEVRNFLDTCQFQEMENKKLESDQLYQKFRHSSYVLTVDFSQFKCSTGRELERNYKTYMKECWKCCGLPKESLDTEFRVLEDIVGSVWTSLWRLRSEVMLVDGNLYVILDSIDNMYNLIANLPTKESQELYSRFTSGISSIIHKEKRKTKTFCFGVSPYLINEYAKFPISCNFIGSRDNKLGEYFSYSDTSIQRMIKKWNLNITVDQCKKVAEFNYNDNCFVNPYLCVSYMRSLKDNGANFEIIISPRSLWMKCIFTKDDLDILYNVFRGEKKCKFAMNVSMLTMCTLPQESKYRQLYYPLFIFGGFLSCKEVTEEKDTYLLSSANESNKILIYHHLEALHYSKFSITVSECQTFLHEYLNGNFHSYCCNLSIFLPSLSAELIKQEKPYHSFMAGILSPLMLDNYELMFDKEFGSTSPDTVIIKDDKIIIEEYKHVIPEKYTPKKARLAVEGLEGSSRSQKLIKFYKPLKNFAKYKIVNLCKDSVIQARQQLSNYAPQFSSKYKKDVELNIIIFYLSHVILLHGKYLYETCQFSEYNIFSSQGYFNNNDLKSILDAK